MSIKKGYVKWFSTSGEAYGYIYRFKHEDGTPGEVFFHYKNILPDNQEDPRFRVVAKGDAVEFELASGYFCNGSQAVNVRKLNAGGQRTEGSRGTASADTNLG